MNTRRPVALVAVSILSLGLLTGCGGGDKVSDKEAEQVLEKAVEEANSDSVDINIDDSEMTVENSDGTKVTINVDELPDDYPIDDVPVIDGEIVAAASTDSGLLVSLKVDDDPEAALAAAVSTLEGAGLKADEAAVAGAGTALLEGNGYQVMLIANDDTGDTVVSYYVNPQ